MKKSILSILALLTGIAAARGAAGTDYVNGTWSAGSIIEVTNHLAVNDGAHLTIEEGTLVKFAKDTSLQVMRGGRLTVLGTLEHPVRFTSLEDFAFEGGNSDLAGYADWNGIQVAGEADFRHAEMHYGGGATQGLLTVRSGGTVHLDRSLVAHAMSIGIWNQGTLRAENSIIYDAKDGLFLDEKGSHGDSTADIRHCIIDHVGEYGVYQYGGDGVIANSSITDYQVYGANYLEGDVRFENCNFYSAGGQMITATPMDANGTLRLDPMYENPEACDFRLKEGSGLIDAGNPAYSVTNDFWGRGRLDVPGVGMEGVLPDIGLHEWQPNYSTQDVDIVVSGVEFTPATVSPGDALTVTWTLRNQGADAFEGTWTDRLTLTPVYGIDVALGESTHTDRIEGKGEKTYTATFTVPIIAERLWNVRVDANADRGILERKQSVLQVDVAALCSANWLSAAEDFSSGDGRENNDQTSVETLTVTIPALDTAMATEITLGSSASAVYTLTGLNPAGQQLVIQGGGDGWTAAGAYLGIPTAAYSWPSMRDGTGGQRLLVPEYAETNAVAYLVLRNTGAPVTLSVASRMTQMEIFRTDRARITLSSNTSVTAEGIYLGAGETGLLTNENSGAVFRAELGGYKDTLRYSVFNLSEAVPGNYRFGIADKNGITVWCTETISLDEPETPGRLESEAHYDQDFHAGNIRKGVVYYANIGDADLELPCFKILPIYYGDSELSLTPEGPFAAKPILLYAEGMGEPKSILKAGESGVAEFYYLAWKYNELGDMDYTGILQHMNSEYARIWQNAHDENEVKGAERAEIDFQSDNTMPYSMGDNGMSGGVVSGRLLMEGTEEPLGGVELYLASTGGWIYGPVVTDSDGGFLFSGLSIIGPAFSREGEDSASRGYYFTSEDVTLALEIAEDAEDSEEEPSRVTPVFTFDSYTNALISGYLLHATERYHTLSGHVTGGGEALEGTMVHLWNDRDRMETLTDANGAWSFERLRGGEYNFRISGSQGYAGLAPTGMLIQADMEFDCGLDVGGRVSGLVTNLETGEGVSCQIGVFNTNNILVELTSCEESGAYEFGGLAADEYYMESLDPDWEIPGRRIDFRVMEGEETALNFGMAESCFFAVWPPIGEIPFEVSIDYYDEARIPMGIETWAWDFNGDGEVDSTDPNPTYVYETAGTNRVTLNVTMQGGEEREYVLAEDVLAYEHREPVLGENVIILGPADGVYSVGEISTDYGYIGSSSNDYRFGLTVTQLVANVEHPITTNTVFIVAFDDNVGPSFAKVVRATVTNGIWSMETEEAKTLGDLFTELHIICTSSSDADQGPQTQRRARGIDEGDDEDGEDEDGSGRILIWEDEKVRRTSIWLHYNQTPGEIMHEINFTREEGFTCRYVWKKAVEVGLDLNIDKESQYHKDIPKKKLCQIGDIDWCIASWGLVNCNFFAKMNVYYHFKLDINKGNEASWHPVLQWTPRVGVRHDQSGWHSVLPRKPTVTFEANEWKLAGDIHGEVSFRAEASMGVKAQALHRFDLVNILRGWAYVEIGGILDANIAREEMTYQIYTDADLGVDVLDFSDTVVAKLYGWATGKELDWSLWSYSLKKGFGCVFPVNFKKLRWPFSGKNGNIFKWPSPLMPNFSFKLGNIFGGLPSWGYDKAWSLPKFDWLKFSWPNGSIPDMGEFDLQWIRNRDWQFQLPQLSVAWLVENLRMPSLDFSIPELFERFRAGNFSLLDFHWPASDVDWNLPCVYLPNLHLDWALSLAGAIGVKKEVNWPDWVDPKWMNLPLAFFIDWGDGSDPYTLEFKDVSGTDIVAELKKILGHQYGQAGIYKVSIGIEMTYVNFINKSYSFLLIVADPDLDNDRIPNLWEMMQASKVKSMTSNPGEDEEGENNAQSMDFLDPGDAVEDFDNDGLSNLLEFLLGCNPNKADTDGDKMPDAFEAMYLVQKNRKTPALNPSVADGGQDADGDSYTNLKEYQREPAGEGQSQSIMEDKGLEDDEWISSDPTEKEEKDDDDDSLKCCPGYIKKWIYDHYECIKIPTKEKCPECYKWKCKVIQEGDLSCRICEIVPKDEECPKPPKERPPKEYCWELKPGALRWCSDCAMHIRQQAASAFYKKVPAKKCKEVGSIAGAVVNLTGPSSGSSGVSGGGAGSGSYGITPGNVDCGSKPDKKKKPASPGPRSGNGKSHSWVFLPTGDYEDEVLDLAVRMGGRTGGVKRALEDNEWSFAEAATGLALGPGDGAAGELEGGRGGPVRIRWNGAASAGAAEMPTAEGTATGTVLGSVPTALETDGSGTAQLRLEYGLFVTRTNQDYVTLVQDWLSALASSNLVRAAELEEAYAGGKVRLTAAEDADGNRVTYVYDNQGRLTASRFADGGQETYAYGSDGLLNLKTRADGEVVDIEHDSRGYATRVQDQHFDYSYDGGTRTYYAAIHYPDGRVGERWYGGDGALTKHAMNGALVYDAAAVAADLLLTGKEAWPEETRNELGKLAKAEYRSGAEERFAWDGPGYRPSEAREADGTVRQWSYDGEGLETGETGTGYERTLERDGAGNVTREAVESEAGREEAEWTWDGAGNATSGRKGEWTRTNTYDAAGRVRTARDAAGGEWTFARDGAGRLTGWLQPDGTAGVKEYDGFGRLTHRRLEGGEEDWWTHSTNGLLTGWSNAAGRRVSYQYDLGHRVAKAIGGDGESETYEYDASGVWRGVAPELRTYVNDGAGGLVLTVTNGQRTATARREWGTARLKEVQTDDQAWRLERNEEGQVTALTTVPTEGAVWSNRWEYDAAGRLTAWTDELGNRSERGYDGAGNVAWETNAAGAGRGWTRDAFGRLLTVRNAAGETATVAHSPSNGATTVTLADGRVLRRWDDAWGREVRGQDAAGTQTDIRRRFDGQIERKSWTNGAATLEADWTYDGEGRLTAQGMAGSWTTRVERVGSNRCTRTTTEYDGFEASVGEERDAKGRVAARTGADGIRSECLYGEVGDAREWSVGEETVWFGYDLTMRCRRMLLADGSQILWTADRAGRTTNVTALTAAGTEAWGLSLERDVAGRIVRSGTNTYVWDAAGRLAGDRSGAGWTVGACDRLTAWPGGSYAHDANGNVTVRTAGGRTLQLTRDLAGRVVEVRDGDSQLVARYAYDAEGRRLGKELGDGTQRRYLWAGDRLQAELDGEGTVLRTYGYWSEEARTPDWVRTGGALHLAVKDGFGAPAALVNATDGSVEWTAAGTDAYGAGWSCPLLPVWADGLQADAETGLMMAGDGRMYDPATGRWLEADLGRLESGEDLYAREPEATGERMEYAGWTLSGTDAEYDLAALLARRGGADAETAASLGRAELLLGLEARRDATARRWMRRVDEATVAAEMRLLGARNPDGELCERKGSEGFNQARNEALDVTTRLDAYGKLRTAMDLYEIFRLEREWARLPESRAAMGEWRGVSGWAGVKADERAGTAERWTAMLLKAGRGEGADAEDLEWLGEAKMIGLCDYERCAARLDPEKEREAVAEALEDLLRALDLWETDCE